MRPASPAPCEAAGVKRIALVIALVLLAAFAAEVWHHFVHFGARSKGAEARRTLTDLCLKQVALKTPVTRFKDLGITLERGNRYAYFIAPGGRLEERTAKDDEATGVQVDVEKLRSGRVNESLLPRPPGNGVFVAAGDIDGDPDLDVWSVSSRSEPPCTPVHERDDIEPGPVARLFQ